MANKPGTKVIIGNTEVVTAGTPVKLTTSPELYGALEIQIQADPSNSGTLIAVGDKNVSAKKELGKTKGLVGEKKGAPIQIEVVDPSSLFVDAETSKDCVTWLAVLA